MLNVIRFWKGKKKRGRLETDRKRISRRGAISRAGAEWTGFGQPRGPWRGARLISPRLPGSPVQLCSKTQLHQPTALARLSRRSVAVPSSPARSSFLPGALTSLPFCFREVPLVSGSWSLAPAAADCSVLPEDFVG